LIFLRRIKQKHAESIVKIDLKTRMRGNKPQIGLVAEDSSIISTL
jgi:hypothetical protein